MNTRNAVLFTVFNRPEPTRAVFEAIRAARPPRLYVAADGPRDRAGEREKCERVREIATAVDWPCELKLLLRAQNLGCRRAMSGAIDWFFENEEQGIVMEDDVLPIPTFWKFCDELLERYRHDERVHMIAGSNLVSERFRAPDSYFFNRLNFIWGWATWRRAWQHYDVDMRQWPAWRDAGALVRMSGGNAYFEEYWRAVLNATYEGKIDTWDYQWHFEGWRKGALVATPARNQIRNIGYGEDATHTFIDAPRYVRESVPRLLPFPLQHPSDVARAPQADRMFEKHVLPIGRIQTLRRRLRQMPVVGDVGASLKRSVTAKLRRLRLLT